MKSIILSYSDVGGAGRAAINIQKSLKNLDVDAQIYVKKKISNLGFVENFYNKNSFIFDKYKERINRNIGKLKKSKNFSYQSPSIFPTNISNKLNKTSFDIVHLCWINEFLSIGDIGRIQKPLIWSLCDMWPFSGISHYEDYDEKAFWREKIYNKFTGFSLDKWMINRKLKSWNSPMDIVVPNKWMFECVRDSKVMSNFDCHIIKWPIDDQIFFNKDKTNCRKKLHFKDDKKIILFGASNGLKDRRKGWQHLHKSLEFTKEIFDVVVLGTHKPTDFKTDFKGEIHFIEKLSNDLELSELYNSVDCLVLPSIHDNTPLISQEAQMCGVPIVVFDHNGLSETVDHKVNGYKAIPLNPNSLATGIDWVLESLEKKKLVENSIKKSEEQTFKNIGKQYYKLYQKVLDIK
jgi:glycosyltransferase involved in cell wall biosynthesis